MNTRLHTKSWFLKLILVVFHMLQLQCTVVAQPAKINEETVKAAFILKFIQNTAFPGISNLEIVYFGENEKQYDSLQRALNNYLPEPNFSLRKTIKIANIKTANIVFIEEDMNPFIKDIYDALSIKSSFLTITSRSNNMIYSMINFIDDEPGITFEINARLMSAKKLKYSEDMLRNGGREVDILDLYFQLEAQLQKNMIALDSHQEEIQYKNTELVNLRRHINDATSEIEALKRLTEKSKLENQKLTGRTDKLNSEILKRSQEISDKSEYIDRLSFNIAQKTKTLLAVSESLETSRSAQAQLDLQLKRRIQEVATQQERLAQYNDEVESLNNTIHLIMLLSCILVFFVTLLWHLIKQNRKAAAHMLKAKQQQVNHFATKAELTALKAQIRPHFLFNTLNTIHIAVEEDPKKAESMLEDLAELFRSTLGVSNKELHLLDNELNMVMHYINIERARYGSKLQFKIHNTLNVNDKILIPVLTIQPLVENAVKYSMRSSEDVSKVIIRLSMDETQLIIEITDNGPGSSEYCQDIQGFGISTDNIKQRLMKLYGEGASLTLQTFKKGGAKSTLSIPSNPTKEFL